VSTKFSEWYEKNRAVFNAKRRERYRKDKTYRERVKAYTRRYRKGAPRRVVNPDGSVNVVGVDGVFADDPAQAVGIRAERLGGGRSGAVPPEADQGR